MDLRNIYDQFAGYYDENRGYRHSGSLPLIASIEYSRFVKKIKGCHPEVISIRGSILLSFYLHFFTI
jgi:hypothetical protein